MASPKLDDAIADPLRGGLEGSCLVHREVSSIVRYGDEVERKRETGKKNELEGGVRSS